MFNTLRDELSKIALMESDDLEFYNDHTVDGDEGAADDELYDEIEECEDEEDFDDLDDGSLNETIDAIINEMIINESYDDDYDDYDYDYDYDYDENGYLNEGDDCDDDDEDDDIFDDDYDDFEFDDDDDDLDMDYGVVGDGKTVSGEPDDDEYDQVDIGGVTNSIHDIKEDIDEDEEDELDELLEAMISEGCDGSDDDNCDHTVRGTAHDLYGDSADMPDNDVPPAPQYSKIMARNKVGGLVSGYGAGNYKKLGNSYFDSEVMNSMTVDDDAYDEEGNSYDLYTSAGNIYDDDENEEYYGIRNKVVTNNLFGRHNINNINNAQLGDRYSGTGDALDESLEAFLAGLDY